jgi:hypothetical protein
MPSFVVFEAFGVRISVQTPGDELAERIREAVKAALPAELTFFSDGANRFSFEVIGLGDGDYSARNADDWIIQRGDLGRVLMYLSSHIRLTVAEHAPRHVFVHAGAVSWKGRGIIIPGSSYSGKSTLTSELVKRGAVYYSDEYAVLDETGFLHPFPKTLSMRGIIDDFQQVEIDVAEFGGSVANGPIQAGAVVITRFREDALWKPRRLRSSLGILEMMKHTVPVRRSPARTLAALNRVAGNSLFLRSHRGDAGETAEAILDYLEQQL